MRKKARQVHNLPRGPPNTHLKIWGDGRGNRSPYFEAFFFTCLGSQWICLEANVSNRVSGFQKGP